MKIEKKYWIFRFFFFWENVKTSNGKKSRKMRRIKIRDDKRMGRMVLGLRRRAGELKSNQHFIGSSCLYLIQIQFAKNKNKTMIRNNNFPYFFLFNSYNFPFPIWMAWQIVVVPWPTYNFLFFFSCYFWGVKKQQSKEKQFRSSCFSSALLWPHRRHSNNNISKRWKFFCFLVFLFDCWLSFLCAVKWLKIVEGEREEVEMSPNSNEEQVAGKSWNWLSSILWKWSGNES